MFTRKRLPLRLRSSSLLVSDALSGADTQPLVAEKPQRVGDIPTQFGPLHYIVEKAVLQQKLTFLESSGSFCRMVCSITRGPAKPISASGSAMFRSPSI